MAKSSSNRLSKGQHAEILRRLEAGERGSILAREFGVSRQAIHFLKRCHDFREGLTDKPPRRGFVLKMKLSLQQWAEIAALLRDTKPADHGVHRIGDEPQHWWTLERGLELARRKFGRTPARSRMKEMLQLHAPRPPRDPAGGIPAPPVRHTEDTLSESQRADPDLAAYLLSDVYWRIQQREYEVMLEEQYGIRRGQARA